MTATRLTNADKLLLVLLCGAAVAVRGLYIYYNQAEFLEPGRLGAYGQLADTLASTGSFQAAVPTAAPQVGPDTTAFWEPGYPIFLAALQRAWTLIQGNPAPETFVQVRVGVQCVLAGLTTIIYYLLALAVFGSTAVAGLTGLLTAVSYFWVIYAGLESNALLTACLLGLWLLATMRLIDRPRGLTLLLVALAGAALVQVRVETLPMVLVGWWWMMWRLRGQHPVAIGLAVAILFLAGLAPWTWRNWNARWPHLDSAGQVAYTSSNYVVPIATHLGYDLWLGNNDAATGGDPLGAGLPAGRQGLPATATQPAASGLAYAWQQPEPLRDLWYARQALDWILDHPYQWLKLRVKALVYFWTTENFWLDPPAVREHWLMLPALVAMLAAALVGLRWSHRWRHRTGLLTIALVMYPLVYVLAHPSLWHEARTPLDGVLLLYGAFMLGCFVPSASPSLRAGLTQAEAPAPVQTLDRGSEPLPLAP